MKKRSGNFANLLFWAGLMLVVMQSAALAQDRFPKPDFDSQYRQPLTQTPPPASPWQEGADVVVLALALGLTSFFAIKKRSRRGIWAMALFSVIYFGFMREGCVCSVGSVQNVSAALFDAGYVIPIGVLAFFVLPLIFTLLYGRTFCAAVCPLGAIQDLVMIKPVKVPEWLQEVLGLFRYIYLGFAILFAATGTAFLVCRYDPFISIFRMSNEFGMILFSGGFLGLSILVARPYCRFLCPYSVLLGWMSALSRRHLSITPDTCHLCRLCEESCPMGAISKPTPDALPVSREQGGKRLAILLAVLPLLILAGGWGFSRLDLTFSKMHPTVNLAGQIAAEDAAGTPGLTLETRTFRSQGTPTETLFTEAEGVRRRFRSGGWLLGAFLGLIFGIKLFQLNLFRRVAEYQPDREACFSCGRCFSYCPNERVRLDQLQNRY
ncbi:MAG TPA: 4Fe-4S binding protein [Calditrichia bacterium]|nr:4Fe-4S binding protein [Calditrichota bacterium]HQU73472.1 4Fe-4S binding protein [Calditrichia bacterium]HQV32648.1 4Fe-4S binding protein [Calditrichia bacterium]